MRGAASARQRGRGGLLPRLPSASVRAALAIAGPVCTSSGGRPRAQQPPALGRHPSGTPGSIASPAARERHLEHELLLLRTPGSRQSKTEPPARLPIERVAEREPKTHAAPPPLWSRAPLLDAAAISPLAFSAPIALLCNGCARCGWGERQRPR
ncbi:hypothetical protein KIL84_023181 [Mauremys mutica]|uniref:Uncharacterized protein n=1 Tax=Mauremys mutica TaxID=74926 RepID=A0A9D3WPD6_9SAUR|nr:hypothetical protein KIL84_023181 [Mauremys mutica]